MMTSKPLMQSVFVYRMARTAIGLTSGLHKNQLPEDLMAMVLKALVSEDEASSVDDCLLANAVGPMGNMARLSWLTAGFPISGTATTVDFQCGGSLKALQLAFGLVASGQAHSAIAGGMESTSLEPLRAYHPRDPRKTSQPGYLTRAQFSPHALGDADMLKGAENTAARFGFTRQELDDYALLSHQRALITADSQILTPYITGPTCGPLIDESLRPSISLRLLNRAKPLLGKDGLITAGNACLMHDGAAGLLIGSRAFGIAHGLNPLAEFLGFSSVGVSPDFSPLGATEALIKLTEKMQLPLEALNQIEINEAFASKVLAFRATTGISLEKINPSGGALAFGHPYSASGAIYTLHTIASLRANGGGLGAIALGVAGGQGIAALLTTNFSF